MSTTRQAGRRPVLEVLLLLSFSGWAGQVTPCLAIDVGPLTGTVRDTVGTLLAGVEVLVVRLPDKTFDPTAVALTDRVGRFEVARLPLGRYRVAALKDGYRTFIGQVDTSIDDSIQVILHPTAKLDESSMPRDASWSLRVPRRGILHDVEDTPGSVRVAGDPTVDAPFDVARRIELAQLFSVSAAAAESHPDDTDIRASETRMSLGSTLGERGKILVEGHRERLGTTQAQQELDTAASEHGASLSMDLAYETGPDANIAVKAFFMETEYGLSAAVPNAPVPVQQQHQTWGYDAEWSKQIDARRHVAVALDYLGTSHVGAMRTATAGLGPKPEFAGADLSNRTLAVEGSYASQRSDGHAVQVAMRAQLLEWPSIPLTTVRVDPAREGLSSWSVQADAQDTWSVTAPFSLVYGLGYKQAVLTRDETLVVPRVGGNLRSGGWLLRGLLSYHSVAGSDEPHDANDVATFRPDDRLGYEAELELPVARHVRVRGGFSYAPIQFDSYGHLDGSEGPGEHPLFLTDGNASVRQRRVAIVEGRGSSRTYFELSDGRADGTLAPLLPFDRLVLSPAGRRLHYRNCRLGLVVPTWGTDLRVEYRRIETDAREEIDRASESVQESIELRIAQNVSGLQIPGDWRLLMALRLGTVRSEELDGWASQRGAETVDALNQRISAGLSVLF